MNEPSPDFVAGVNSIQIPNEMLGLVAHERITADGRTFTALVPPENKCLTADGVMRDFVTGWRVPANAYGPREITVSIKPGQALLLVTDINSIGADISFRQTADHDAEPNRQPRDEAQ